MSYQGFDRKSSEYFCNRCGQFRLAVAHHRLQCGNCGSKDIITGDVGSLDKDKLKEDYAKKITNLDKITTQTSFKNMF